MKLGDSDIMHRLGLYANATGHGLSEGEKN